MRIIDADALIERLKKDSPDPEGVDEWIDIINDECGMQYWYGKEGRTLDGFTEDARCKDESLN